MKNKSRSASLRRSFFLILIPLIITAMMLLLTPRSHPISSAQFANTLTPSIQAIATVKPAKSPAEPDVSNGIIMAGSLLVLVIIMGTLIATRGFSKSPQKH